MALDLSLILSKIVTIKDDPPAAGSSSENPRKPPKERKPIEKVKRKSTKKEKDAKEGEKCSLKDNLIKGKGFFICSPALRIVWPSML